MAIHDIRSQRLFVTEELNSGRCLGIERTQANYLLNVLRIKDGSQVRIFNGRDGEWLAEAKVENRKSCHLTVKNQTRAQSAPPRFHCLFAPLKQARLDYVVQKAVEMGASHIRPVITQHTQIRKPNEKRMRANAIEAAEQCGILYVPDIGTPLSVNEIQTRYDDRFTIVLCDEAGSSAGNLSRLKAKKDLEIALLVGPEGGFSDNERNDILQLPNVVALNLGPRVLRADTAAVAAMAVIQAEIGDWYTDR